MLKFNGYPGQYISNACSTAAQLAKLSLAADHVPGHYYAVGASDDGAWLILIGPWKKPEGVSEDYEGQAFRNHCRENGFSRALQLFADESGPGVALAFNEIEIYCDILDADASTEVVAEALHEQWKTKLEARTKAYWTPERLAKQEAEREAYEQDMVERRGRCELALSLYPFQPNDPKKYAVHKEKNKDGYGAAITAYAEAWAALMESALHLGGTVAEVAEATRDVADYDGITGFQYGCAVQLLVTFWGRGEALRQWHNGEYGHDGEGVVNPALLTVR